MKGLVKTFAVGLIVVTAAMGVAQGQTRVDAKKDWSVFEAASDNGKVCWVVSQPTKSTARRGGKDVEVKRGDIFLMVATRKADKVSNEVSFLAGYPFESGSNVTIKVGSNSFSLFTDGENAWTKSSAEDKRVTQAFRRGARAVVTGKSQRGTTTTDTFSLSGFTAALKAAQARCN